MTEIKTAMLLAAGLGTRMRPLTEKQPKPMIEVNGRSLIHRLLDKLVAADIERAVINVHYLADKLEDHLKDRNDLEILISDERSELLETGGGVVKALPLLGDDPVFILNTDACWEDLGDETFQDMMAEWNPGTMDGLLMLADRMASLGFEGDGDFFLHGDNRLQRRGENPDAPYAFAGAYILNPKILTDYSVEPFSANIFWDKSLEEGRLSGHVMGPYWMHVGDPDARDEAEAYLVAMEGDRRG